MPGASENTPEKDGRNYRRRLSDSEKKKITERFMSGSNMKTIAADLGIAYQQVHYFVTSRKLKDVKKSMASHDAGIVADASSDMRQELVEKKRQEIVEARIQKAIEHEQWRFDKIDFAKARLDYDVESEANLRVMLGNLKGIDDLARKAFHLDDSAEVNDAQRNVAILLNVSVSGGQAGQPAPPARAVIDV